MIGKIVNVTIDRPMGTSHPKYPQNIYPINYGYVEGVMAPDGDWQDVYLLGVNEPVKQYTGKIIAIVKRNDDNEEKWVVAPEGMDFSIKQIAEKIDFIEKFYNSYIIK